MDHMDLSPMGRMMVIQWPVIVMVSMHCEWKWYPERSLMACSHASLRFLLGLGLSSGHMTALILELGTVGGRQGLFLGRTHAKVRVKLFGFQLNCAGGRRGPFLPTFSCPRLSDSTVYVCARPEGCRRWLLLHSHMTK